MTRTDRRDFLKAAAVTAAFPFHAFADDEKKPAAGKKLPPSERVRIGFIGVRNQGTYNLKTFLKQPAVEVVALCDVDKNVLAAAAALAETEAHATDLFTTGDYRRLLDRKDIDAVCVTTPDHWHALPTIQACMAGKDVYCEKPLSLTVAEGRAMVQAARKYNRIVQTGSQQRSEYKGYFRIAAELVRNGKLGKLKGIKVGIPKVNFKDKAVAGAKDGPPPPELDYDFWLGQAPERPYNVNRVHYLFRFFWDYSGGQLTNFGAHDLDIVQWALGMDDSGPVRVEAVAVRFPEDHAFEVPTSCETRYTYADGTVVQCGQDRPGFKGGITFEGEKGTLHVDRKTLASDPPELLKQEIGSSDAKLYVSTNHHGNFLACVKSRKRPVADVASGHRSATVCHLGNIAIRHGQPIHWDPASETILGDAAAAAMLSRPRRSPWELPAV